MSLKFEIRPSATPTSDKDRLAKLENPGFGRVFSEHMVIVQYTQGQGWHSARIESRANFPLDPAGAVLHYAQEIFEGLKAYRRDDGGVNLFRPDANAKRFQDSAERMAMAKLTEDGFSQEIFEGLKAYRRDDGGVNLFRPDANAKRFQDSAERMAMAKLPEDVFIEAVEQLVRVDRAWIPGGEGSLYLRPFMIASEVFLGVKPSS